MQQSDRRADLQISLPKFTDDDAGSNTTPASPNIKTKVQSRMSTHDTFPECTSEQPRASLIPDNTTVKRSLNPTKPTKSGVKLDPFDAFSSQKSSNQS